MMDYTANLEEVYSNTTHAILFPGTECVWFHISRETWKWRSTETINILDALRMDIWIVILEIMKGDV
jgi:hypothetical protein